MDDELNVDLTVSADPALLEGMEALRLLAEAEQEAEIKRLTDMRALVAKLARKRDESIKAKREIDRMALDSLRIYRGEDRYNDATKTQAIPSEGGPRSRTPHLLRARTDRWEARMCDMLSATPWGLEPDCGKYSDDPQAQAQAEADAQLRCDGMEEKIKSQWNKSRADRHIRKMCRDAARKGTGLISGPFATVERKRRYRPKVPAQDGWQQGGYVPVQPAPVGVSVMGTEETTFPEIREGDMLFFFPDMTPSADQAEFAHYLHLMGPMEIRNLAPGFDPLQINALLKTEPDLGEVRQTLALHTQYLDQPDMCRDRYAVWHFTGVLGKDELDVLGLEIPPECECPDTELGSESPPPMAMADIWYCQDFVLRATLAKVPDDFRIPYYLFAPFRLEGSMFGQSLPMLGEDSQIVIKAAWAMALHNQSVSSGPLIVERTGKMIARDKQASYRGPKVYSATDDNIPLDDLMKVWNIPNESQGALTILDRAVAILDEELNTSQWASSEGASEHDTASGLAMIFNSQSILQLMVAATADDDVYEPVITRMIWWNNDHGTDESIKGDFLVKPLVQSERLVKDVQAQQAQVLAQMSDNPRFAKFSKDYDLYKYLVGFMDGPVSNFVKTETEVAEEAQNQPPDPQQLQAQYLQTRAETEQLRAEKETIVAQTEQIKQQIALLELQGAQNPQGVDPAAVTELGLKQRELDLKEKQINANLDIAEMREQGQRMVAAAKAAEQRQQAAEFAYEKQQDRQTELMRAGMEAEQTAQEVALKRQYGSGI